MSANIAVLTATSGQYEDYRTRPVRAYRSTPVAITEAERMNVLVLVARKKIRETWEWSDEKYDAGDRTRARVLGSLRRALRDKYIDLTEVDDLAYHIEGLTLEEDVA